MPKCPHCNAESKTSHDCSNCGKVIVAKVEKKRKLIKPIGDKKYEEIYLFGMLREVYLILNPWCQFEGCKDKACDIHHAKGHIGYYDDWARQNKISLYLDMRFFKGLCRDHHTWVETHPNEAKEKGLSFDRLSKQ